LAAGQPWGYRIGEPPKKCAKSAKSVKSPY
jgi:hypothetical protein